MILILLTILISTVGCMPLQYFGFKSFCRLFTVFGKRYPKTTYMNYIIKNFLILIIFHLLHPNHIDIFDLNNRNRLFMKCLKYVLTNIWYHFSSMFQINFELKRYYLKFIYLSHDRIM